MWEMSIDSVKFPDVEQQERNRGDTSAEAVDVATGLRARLAEMTDFMDRRGQDRQAPG